MPTSNAHLSLARRNLVVIEYLMKDCPNCLEWVATVSFYTAVHLFEHIIGKDNQHSSDHGDRERRMKEHRFKHFHKHYFVLKNASMVARYLTTSEGDEYSSFSDFMSAEDVKNKLVAHYLNQIQSSTATLTKK